MALVEDDLPGVSKGELVRSFFGGGGGGLVLLTVVRTDFQLREDQVLASRLQEQECMLLSVCDYEASY